MTEKVKADREMVCAYEQDKADFDSFAAVIRKYVGITELTPTIVNEFVKKIIVHAPDKSSGHRRQKIQIIWNFVGDLKQDEDKQKTRKKKQDSIAICHAALQDTITSLWVGGFDGALVYYSKHSAYFIFFRISSSILCGYNFSSFFQKP